MSAVRVALGINGWHVFRRDIQEPKGPYPQPPAQDHIELRRDGTDEVVVAVRDQDGHTWLAVAKLERIS